MIKYLKLVIIILLFVFVGSLFIHSLDSINQDIGRHIKTGQIIWETKSVPKINFFSFTEPSQPFINHHWLSEVAFFGLNNLAGLKGLIVFKAIILLAVFILLFFSVYKKTGLWPLLVSFLFGIFVFIERTDVRPEIFSYLFLAYFLFAIFRYKYRGEFKWFYALPFIQIIWTNSHIYFALGPGLFFLFLIDRFIHERENKNLLKKLGLVFVFTCLATLINPSFIKGALEPFNILRNYGYSIVENQTLSTLKDFGIAKMTINFFELSVLVLIASFIVALKNGSRKITFEFLSAGVFTFMGFYMLRNVGIYAMLFIPVVALNFHASGTPAILKNRNIKIASGIIASIFIIWLTANIVNDNFYIWDSSVKRFGLIIPNGAEPAVEFVKNNNIQGPVFNNFDVGSFLIWKLYPQQKVFVDGRPEAYSVNFFKNIYEPMQSDPALWKKYSEQYGINYVFFDTWDITDWGRAFLYYISRNSDWPLVYRDNATAIFIKRIPANIELIRKFAK